MDDYSADVNTTGSVTVGSFATGDLESSGDLDWFKVQLTQGSEYQIYLQGSQANSGPHVGGTLADPSLAVMDGGGHPIAGSTNSYGLNEVIDFVAPATGTYFLQVGSGEVGGTGTYTISVKPYASLPQYADYLLKGFWTYANEKAPDWPKTDLTVNVSNLSAPEKAFALAALQAYQDATKLTFTQTTGPADISFDDSGSHVEQFLPTFDSNGVLTHAVVQISSDVLTGSSFATHAFQSYLHELGHALGLGHSGPYNGGSPIFGIDNLFGNDNLQWSVMTYFGWPGQALADRTVTPQTADIYALQTLYGPNPDTRAGDTVYGFHSTAGPLFDFANYQTSGVSFTIYDTGGQDTLDASGFSADQVLDLTPGAFSSVGGFSGNIGIYPTTLIESAIGGSGNDRLLGNAAGDQLYGGPGDDTLTGGSGQNYLRGGDGNDSIAGGAGFDDINGNKGDDTITGGPGDDWLVGGQGNDSIISTGGQDILYGNLGSDTLTGGPGPDLIRGGQADDVLSGGPGNDWLSGDRGSDTLTGGSGADIFHTFPGPGWTWSRISTRPRATASCSIPARRIR